MAALSLLLWAKGTVGLGALLPHQISPDPQLVEQARVHRGEVAPLNNVWAKYPHALSRLIAASPRTELPGALDPEDELEAHLAYAGRDHLAARRVIWGLCSLLVPLTYLLARLFLSRPWAAAAAFLCGTSLLVQQFGSQERPHAGYAPLALLALLICVHYRRRPGIGSFTAAAAACGLACGGLHSGAFALLGLALAFILRERGSHGFLPRGRELIGIAAGAVVFIALVRVFYPFLFAEPPSPFDGRGMAPEFPHPRPRFNGAGFERIADSLWGYDPVLTILSCVALARASMRGARALAPRRASPTPADAFLRDPRTRDRFVVVVPALAVVLVLGGHHSMRARFLMPLMPFVACLAAAGLAELAACRGLGRRAANTRTEPPFASTDFPTAHGPRRLPCRPLGLVLVASVLTVPGIASVRFTWLRSRPETNTLAAQWLAARLDPRSERALIHAPLSIPLFQIIPPFDAYDRATSELPNLWAKHQLTLARTELESPRWPVYPLARHGVLPHGYDTYPHEPREIGAVLDSLRADWAVVERGSRVAEWTRQELAARGELRAVLTPWRAAYSGEPSPMAYESEHFFLDVLRAQRMGPVIEIYRLDR